MQALVSAFFIFLYVLDFITAGVVRKQGGYVWLYNLSTV